MRAALKVGMGFGGPRQGERRIDDRRQGMLDDLRGAKAEDFDHRYISQQIAAHKEADILMHGYAKDGDNTAIKDFAATTDKAVKMHTASVALLVAAAPEA